MNVSLIAAADRILFHCAKHGAILPKPLHARGTYRFYYDRTRSAASTPAGLFSFRTVDLRSDTVTKPGTEMRRAMFEAEVGDDVFGEDPTVNELQKMAADMFGMEAALFVPSGTMANLIAVMVHCRQRGDEMIVGDLSHLHIYEQGGSAQLAGVHSTTISNFPDGTFDLNQLESKIRHGYPDPHYPRTRLLCLENTHNIRGGRVLPLSFLQETRQVADRYGLAVHMDGARLMNAVVAQGVCPAVILQHTHTVSACLSKGLGAPVGTLLCGSKDFVAQAVRARKVLGGGMRQAGILAAAGRMALTDMVGRLEQDHNNARTFAQALLQCNPPLYHIDMAAVETNILLFRISDPTLTPAEFCERMGSVSEEEVQALGQGIRVLMFPHTQGFVRAVWHLGVSQEDTELAIQKLQLVARQHVH